MVKTDFRAAAPRRPLRRFALGDFSYAYLTLGPAAGREAVFLHGFGGNLRGWQHNLAAFGPGVRLHALDIPGHGGSDLPAGFGSIADFGQWLLASLDALGIGRPHVVAHSFGAWIALEAARLAPGRFERLSLIGCAGVGEWADLPLLRRVLDEPGSPRAKEALLAMSDGDAETAASVGRSLGAHLDLPGARGALLRLVDEVFPPALETAGVGRDWSAATVPIQFIWGSRDSVVPLPPVERLPSGRLHLIDGAGHMVHIQRAPAVNDLLRRFAEEGP